MYRIRIFKSEVCVLALQLTWTRIQLKIWFEANFVNRISWFSDKPWSSVFISEKKGGLPFVEMFKAAYDERRKKWFLKVFSR